MAISIEIGTIQDAIAVEAGIPEFGQARTEEDYIARINHRTDLILIAKDISEIGKRLVGFKVGYALNETTFYSWVGGVIPGFRRLHLAQQMLEKQEAWVKDQGYKQLDVKSMNKFPGMLMLLIKNGYQIFDIENRLEPDVAKIVFRKVL